MTTYPDLENDLEDNEENFANDIDILFQDRFTDVIEEDGVEENLNTKARQFYNVLNELINSYTHIVNNLPLCHLLFTYTW